MLLYLHNPSVLSNQISPLHARPPGETPEKDGHLKRERKKHTHKRTHIHARLFSMAGPACAVMCNSMNKHTHTQHSGEH